MKPWNEKQFKYENLFEQLNEQNVKDTQSREIGKVLVILIALCKDTQTLPEEEKERFWNHISEDINELDTIVENYIKEEVKDNNN